MDEGNGAKYLQLTKITFHPQSQLPKHTPGAQEMEIAGGNGERMRERSEEGRKLPMLSQTLMLLNHLHIVFFTTQTTETKLQRYYPPKVTRLEKLPKHVFPINTWCSPCKFFKRRGRIREPDIRESLHEQSVSTTWEVEG